MPRIIDQFGRKMCQKKRKDVDYKLLLDFFQKYFVKHERLAVKNSFSILYTMYIHMLYPSWLYPGQFILIESVSQTKTMSRSKQLIHLSQNVICMISDSNPKEHCHPKIYVCSIDTYVWTLDQFRLDQKLPSWLFFCIHVYQTLSLPFFSSRNRWKYLPK